ncbi:MAG: hypothetical protein ACXVPU_03365 [Bacteroidia bacterium]
MKKLSLLVVASAFVFAASAQDNTKKDAKPAKTEKAAPAKTDAKSDAKPAKTEKAKPAKTEKKAEEKK